MNQNRDRQTERELFREEPTVKEATPAVPTGKKSWLFTLLFVLIAAMTFWAVTAQIKDFSFSDFAAYIGGANPAWLIAAVACMLGFAGFWIPRAVSPTVRVPRKGFSGRRGTSIFPPLRPRQRADSPQARTS